MVVAQFRRWRAREDVVRNDVARAKRVGLIAPITNAVYKGFVNILEHSIRADHIAVQRAVAGCQFGFIARIEYQRAVFIRYRHENHAANTRLQVFLGHIGWFAIEHRREHLRVQIEHFFNRHHVVAHTDALRHVLRIIQRHLRRVARRHHDRMYVFRAQRIHRHRQHQSRINPAGQTEAYLFESRRMHIVTHTHDHRAVGFHFLAWRLDNHVFVPRFFLRIKYNLVHHRYKHRHLHRQFDFAAIRLQGKRRAVKN